MNFKKIFKTVGKILVIESAFMFIAFVVGLCYGEFYDSLGLGLSSAGTCLAGLLLSLTIKPNNRKLYARDGFLLVGLCWLAMSLFACLPYMTTGSIKNFFSAFFESSSGFTTTGGSVIKDVTVLSHGVLLWRELTHWLGGMGILVFMLAVFPSADGETTYIFGAESTGYRSDKIAPKMRYNALILYIIYISFTVLEACLLAVKMPVFDAVIHAMGTVSTGGFSSNALSVMGYGDKYVEIVITVFMFLCSLNFSLYFLLILGSFKEVLKSEELRVYVVMMVVSILIIALSLLNTYDNFATCLRYSSFQALSFSSTTGFFSADFTNWPTIGKSVLIFLMLIGGMGGSTAGGMKVARACIIMKTAKGDLTKVYRPNRMICVKFDGKTLSATDTANVRVFVVLYFTLLIISAFLLSLAGMISKNPTTLGENVTGALSAISNVGPFFGNATAYAGDFTCFNGLQKLILSIDMLAGRLEIFPIMLVFMPGYWRYK